jgi:hypothetical protein
MCGMNEMLDAFVRATMALMETRDPNTARHSARVAVLTVGLAEMADGVQTGPFRELRFTRDEREAPGSGSGSGGLYGARSSGPSRIKPARGRHRMTLLGARERCAEAVVLALECRLHGAFGVDHAPPRPRQQPPVSIQHGSASWERDPGRAGRCRSLPSPTGGQQAIGDGYHASPVSPPCPPLAPLDDRDCKLLAGWYAR